MYEVLNFQKKREDINTANNGAVILKAISISHVSTKDVIICHENVLKNLITSYSDAAIIKKSQYAFPKYFIFPLHITSLVLRLE